MWLIKINQNSKPRIFVLPPVYQKFVAFFHKDMGLEIVIYANIKVDLTYFVFSG